MRVALAALLSAEALGTTHRLNLDRPSKTCSLRPHRYKSGPAYPLADRDGIDDVIALSGRFRFSDAPLMMSRGGLSCQLRQSQ
jgi:hypothetical protein